MFVHFILVYGPLADPYHWHNRTHIYFCGFHFCGVEKRMSARFWDDLHCYHARHSSFNMSIAWKIISHFYASLQANERSCIKMPNRFITILFHYVKTSRHLTWSKCIKIYRNKPVEPAFFIGEILSMLDWLIRKLLFHTTNTHTQNHGHQRQNSNGVEVMIKFSISSTSRGMLLCFCAAFSLSIPLF